MIYIYFKHIIFQEVAKSLYQSLREFNFNVNITDKLLNDVEDLHIIFGANDFLEFIPQKYIIYQLEQTNISENGEKKNLPEKYIHIMRKALAVWDYSQENIKYLEKTYNLKNLFYVPVLYSPTLQTITSFKINKPIDILFLGSLNKRRENIIKKLQMNKNYIIEVGNYNIWNEKRDYLVDRSKIVLNIHYYENSILETTRISYLLANKAFVISESGRDKILNNQMEGLIIFSSYNNLVDTCSNYLKNPELCLQIAENGYNQFKQKKYLDVIPMNHLSLEEKSTGVKKNKKNKKELNIYIPKPIEKAPTTKNSDDTFLLKLPKIEMNDLPNVSIITPTGNRRLFFSLALKNYQSFIYPREKIEWIILDDGTESIGDLIPKDKSIRYIKMDCDGNRLPIGCKRNKAVEYASHEYIVFMDDDDYYTPESLLARVKLLINPNVDCVGCSSVGCYNLITNESVLAEDSNNALCEATLAFKKKFWEERKFDEGDLNNESKFFLQYRQDRLLDIPFQFIMVAFNHNNNLTSSLREYDNFDKWYSDNKKEYINLYDSLDVITQIFLEDLKKVIIKDYKTKKNENISNNIPQKMSYTMELPNIP